MQKVAVLLYLYHTSMWDELFFLLKKLKGIKLYIAVDENIDISVYQKQCKNTFEDVIFTKIKNKGLDLYPFVQQISLLNRNDTPFFIKLHTKKSILQDKNYNFDWSNILIHSVIGSAENLKKNIQILQSDEKIGALCLESFILTHNETIHRDKIVELCNLLNVPYNLVHNNSMMAGSIFYGKTDIFQNFLTKKNINTLQKYLEENISTQPSTATYTHAFECILSYFIQHRDLKIYPCYVDSIKIYNKQINKNITLIRSTYNNVCYIQENPLLNGVIIKQTNNEIHIKWKNTVDSNRQIYRKNKKGSFIRIEESEANYLSGFNVKEYKRVNVDLLHLTNEEAYQHYLNHGIKEGRVLSSHEVQLVFDNEFYIKTYNITDNPLNEFLTKGRFENRIYNSIILNDKFDYGFYIGYKNLQQINNKINNQYKALYSYINETNINQKKCNNIINIVDVCNDSTNKTLCIYVGIINTRRDEYFIRNDLEILNETCDIYIILNKASNYIKANKIKKHTTPTWEFECYLEALKITKTANKYKNIIFLTNKTVLLFSLNQFISTFKASGLNVMSLTDSNTKHIYSDKHTYHLHMDCIIFTTCSKNIIIEFLQQFIKKAKTHAQLKIYEFEFTQNLVKQNKTFGALLTPTKELELLWNELLTVEINKKPELLFKYKIPAIQKDLLFYFNQLKTIFSNKIKHSTRFQPRMWLKYVPTNIITQYKIACILNVYTHANICELQEYIKTLHNKCKVDFYITGNESVYNKLYTEEYNMCFLRSENKGMDIGPFLHTLIYFKSNNLQYDYIIKLQEKKTTHWRRYLFTNIIENLEQYIDFLSEKDVSFTGAKSYLYHLDDVNKDTINHFLIRNNIPFNYEIESQYNGFFAGTMFIMKYSTFTDFIEKYKIDLAYEYEILEEGAVTNEFATNTHAWERILSCVIPTVQNTKLKCI